MKHNIKPFSALKGKIGVNGVYMDEMYVLDNQNSHLSSMVAIESILENDEFKITDVICMSDHIDGSYPDYWALKKNMTLI